MNPTLIAGVTTVNLALIAYTFFFLTELRSGKAGNKVIIPLAAGVVFDITATVLMIAGSPDSPFSVHGFIGYSSLAGMLTDAILIWRQRIKYGLNSTIPSGVHRFSIIAYSWWITAYITGLVLVIIE